MGRFLLPRSRLRPSLSRQRVVSPMSSHGAVPEQPAPQQVQPQVNGIVNDPVSPAPAAAEPPAPASASADSKSEAGTGGVARNRFAPGAHTGPRSGRSSQVSVRSTPRARSATPRARSAGTKPRTPTSARSSTPGSARSNASTTSSILDRPAWDDTPLRCRPPALRGMSSRRQSEPWARDELQYNRKFFMLSDYHGNYDLAERSEQEPGRKLRHEIRRTDYFGRWNNKFIELNTQLGGLRESGAASYNPFDGNPFT